VNSNSFSLHKTDAHDSNLKEIHGGSIMPKNAMKIKRFDY